VDVPDTRRSAEGAALGCRDVLEADAGWLDERPPKIAGPYDFHAARAASRLDPPAADRSLPCGGAWEGPDLLTSPQTTSIKPESLACKKPTTLFWKDAIVESSSVSFAVKKGRRKLW